MPRPSDSTVAGGILRAEVYLPWEGRIVKAMRRAGLLLAVLAALALPAATPSGVANSSPVGTWTRTTTCQELLTALRRADLGERALEMIVGNSFLPGVRSVGQVKDRAHPCRRAVPRAHSHFFTEGGRFGSLDWKRDEVDDGRYRVRGNRLIISKEFPSVTFRFAILGDKLTLTPVIPRGCTTFRCAWAISMAYPGKSWIREKR